MLPLNLSAKQNSSKKRKTTHADDKEDTINLKIKMDTDIDAHVVDMCKEVASNRGKLDELNEKIWKSNCLMGPSQQVDPCMN